jgi:5'-deoxynucleotidase YfbR-like HD superfamily hydrolase
MTARCYTPSLFEESPELLAWQHQTITEQAETGASIVEKLARLTMDFANVKRAPRYDPYTPESDVEHSYMVALFGVELAARYFPDLDLGKIALRMLAHDMVELETGDIVSFLLTKGELEAKAAREHAARMRLAKRLTPTWQEQVDGHEDQIDAEAQFCKHVEKLAPVIVDLLGPGEMVMKEDLDITTGDELWLAEQGFSDRMHSNFPMPEHDIIHAIRELLAARFQTRFDAATEETA